MHMKRMALVRKFQTDKAMSIEDHEASNRKIEFSQSDAIKLVQQAFDKILSEIPDHSLDDQPIASEITSDQDFLLKKQDEGKEVCISTSSNSIEDCMIQDQEEMQLQTDNKIASEEVKASQMEGKKADKQMPNSWSNLKKIIILEICPVIRKGEELKATHNPIPTYGQRTRSRKVIPLPENGDAMRSNAAPTSPTTSVPAYNESSVHNGNSAKKENDSEILAGKALYREMSSKDDQVQGSESHIAYHQSLEASPEPKERNLLCGCTEQPLCIAGSEMSGTDMKKEYNVAVDDNNVNEVSIVKDVQQKLVDLSLSELEEPGLSDKSLTNEGAVRTS
ncbi:hypothetical protein CRYUN_Cryun16bG0071700 [Craigia yunnanensis]